MSELNDFEKVHHWRKIGYKPAVVYWSEKAKHNEWKAEYLSDCESTIEYDFCQSVIRIIEKTMKRLDRMK